MAERRSALGHLQSPKTFNQAGPPPFSGEGILPSRARYRKAFSLQGPTLLSSPLVFTPFEMVVAWIVTFAAAVFQGTVGFGFAILSVPILTLLDPAFTPIPQLFLAAPLTLAAAWRERYNLDLQGLGWIVAGRVPGALLGAWTLTLLPERVLDFVIAGIVILAVGAIASGWTIRLNRPNRVIAGFASGFSGTTSAIGGPPMALLYRNASGGVIRSSLGAIFAIGLAINLSSLYATGAVVTDDYRVVGLLMIPALAGFLLSSRFTSLVEGKNIRGAILIVSMFASVSLLVRAIVS